MFTFIQQKNILRLVFLNCNERDFESSIKIPGTFPHFLSSRFLIMTIYSLKYTDIIVNSLINITHNTNSSLYVTVRLSHLFPRFFFFLFIMAFHYIQEYFLSCRKILSVLVGGQVDA